MYEQLRNDFIRECEHMDRAYMNMALEALDKVIVKYELTRKTTDLAVIDTDMTPELVKIYLACKVVAGQSAGTVKNARSILSRFFTTVGKAPGDITANDIRMWLYSCKENGSITDRTLDKYLMNIRSFFEWAVQEEYIEKNPSKKVPKIKYEAKQREALNQIELEYLRKACRSKRETAIIETLYSTGCRVSELTGIKLSDIDFTMKTVHVFGKGKKHRTVFLNAKAIVSIQEYMAERKGDSEYLFCSQYAPFNRVKSGCIEKVVRDIADRTENINKAVSPHILRHTMATQGLNTGMEIATVSRILGHESINTTMIYAQMDDENIQAQHSKYVV